MSQSMFSPLAHGCGSWDGDLQRKSARKHHAKSVLHRSVGGEPMDHLEKRVQIPLRIKSKLTQIQSILREASKNFPADQNLANTIRLKTENTEYSRPLGSIRISRPRTGVIRAGKQQPRSSLTSEGVPRMERLHRRAKSAPTSRQSRAARIDATLPKTLTTRKGALMIFTSPKNVAFSVPEQRCYYVDPDAADLEGWATNLHSFKKMTSSVLQYGLENDDAGSVVSASDYDTSCFRLLRKDEDERGVDYRLQPGGDFVFYLRDMKTRAAVRNVVSSMTFAPTPTQDDVDETDSTEDDEDEEIQQIEDQIQHSELLRSGSINDSVPPMVEYLRPASSNQYGDQAWASQTETESIDIWSQTQTGSAHPTDAGVRFPAGGSPNLVNVAEMNLQSRPGTARSNRSVGSWRSGTPLSMKELTASIKSSGYLGRSIASPFPPYSPHSKQPFLAPEVDQAEKEEEEEEASGEEIEEDTRSGISVSVRSRSHQSSRLSSHPKSSRASSRLSHVSDENDASDGAQGDGRSSQSRHSRISSATSHRSPGIQSQEEVDGDREEIIDVDDDREDDDWKSEDLAELGVEDIEQEHAAPEEVDGGADAEGVVQGEGDIPQNQSRASSYPQRVYTPKTRSSRRSTPPPDGDQWPGLDDGLEGEQTRAGSGLARTSSAKSRQSGQSRPSTSGSRKTPDVPEEEEETALSNTAQEKAPTVLPISGDEESFLLVGEGMGVAQEQEVASKTPSVSSRPQSSHSRASPHLQPAETAKTIPTIAPAPAPLPQPPAPSAALSRTPAPPQATVKSPVPKDVKKVEVAPKIQPKVEEKPKRVDLSSLLSSAPKKPTSSIPKTEKRSTSPKGRKGRRGKGGGSSPSRKFAGVQFIDTPQGASFDEPSKDEIAKMIQEELSQQLAEANISIEEETETKEEEKDPLDIDRVSVATDDEAIEKEIKQKTKSDKGSKKSKKQLAKEKAALKEARRLEKQRREEEKKALAERKKQMEAEKKRQEYEEKRRKAEIEEQLRDAEEEARRAEEEEEMARQMLQESRRVARDEREKRRKEEMERKKEERERQREERKKMEEAARLREQEMAERLADAAERRRLREEAEWEAEEREREERERREQEEDEERRRMEEEEDRIRELERQAEQEALERLMRERRDAEERRKRAREEAQSQKEEEQQRMREELKRLAEEEERQRQREKEAEMRRQEELEKIRKIQQMEEEAKARVQKKLESRRIWALRRREKNNEHRNHLNGLRHTHGTTRPWVFSYYVLWPRETYERRLPSKKKQGFRPRPKPPAAPSQGGQQVSQNAPATQEVSVEQMRGIVMKGAQ